MSKQFFGTDGIRGEVGKYPVTADFMLKLGWAAGKVFAEASNMLKIALEASDAKTKAKLQQIDLMIRKQRADKMGGGPSNDDVQLGQATVFDRNELLKMISENSKNPK